MATVPQPGLMTLEEYLEMEDRTDVKHEFFHGETFEIEAGSYRHQQIGGRFFGAAKTALRGSGCEIQFSGTRIATGPDGLYTYPDLVIICGKPKFLETDPSAVVNPRVIVEILSRRTRDYDRGGKFEFYRGIASLEEYVNIHQEAPYIEHHLKQQDSAWLCRDLRGVGATLQLTSVAIEIPFAEIYEGIEFDTI
jgi:Uma2 family endonuclease